MCALISAPWVSIHYPERPGSSSSAWPRSSAALGLLRPAPLLHILVILTPLAAVGLAIVMVGATPLTHVRLKETSRLAPPAVLLIMAVVVAWDDSGAYHFSPPRPAAT